MKKNFTGLVLSLALPFIFSCGPNMYHTSASAKEDVAYIVVLAQDVVNTKKLDVLLEIDGLSYPVSRVFKAKDERKALPFELSPGKHSVALFVNGQEYSREEIIVGVQETRKIIIK